MCEDSEVTKEDEKDEEQEEEEAVKYFVDGCGVCFPRCSIVEKTRRGCHVMRVFPRKQVLS